MDRHECGDGDRGAGSQAPDLRGDRTASPHYGDELLGGVYRVSAEAERVGAHVTGYTGRHSTLRVTVLSDAERE